MRAPQEVRSVAPPARGVSRSLGETFLETARRRWSEVAMADSSGREVSFGRALAGAILFRRSILRQFPDQRMIGVMLPTSVPAALLNLGITLAGRIPVNLNYTISPEARAAAIERCGIRTVVTSGKLLERLSIPRQPGMVMMEDMAARISPLSKLATLTAARALPMAWLKRWLLPREAGADSLATVVFSSGSTAEPKGVMLSHRNILANIEGIRRAIDLDERDGLLGVLPFFHAFGLTVGLWLPALVGLRAVYHTSPLEARVIGELARRYQVTLLIATPTFAAEYARRCRREDFSSLRLAIVGAEKMRPELARTFREKFGKELHEGYGCTELSPVVAVNAIHGPDRNGFGVRPGSVGQPLPGVRARVVHPETFAECATGEEGLLLIQGENVMMGYFEEPERTREAIRDGWYVTGDIARLDADGFITITDRVTRFSKIAGEMVPHLRVENALHDAVGSSEARMVVTSVADDLRGERLVVLHTPLALSVEELLHRVRESSGLPMLWLPRRDSFFTVESLPLLGSGKLDMKRVKETAERLASQTVPAAAKEAAS